jgi:hypothetical protein
MKALSEAAEIRPDDLQVRLRAKLAGGNFRMSFTNKIDGKSRSLGTWALFRPKPWPNTGKSAKTAVLQQATRILCEFLKSK